MAELRAPLEPLLQPLLPAGACIIPGGTLPVPIPLNAIRQPDPERLVWATGSSVLGFRRPCVGVISLIAWERDEATGGVVVYGRDGSEVRIVLASTLSLGQYRLRQILKDQKTHEDRVATDPAYAAIWARALQTAA